MNLDDKKLLEENNLILKALVKIKATELIDEIKTIGINNMDLRTISHYRKLVGELENVCGYGSSLYDPYGAKLHNLSSKLSKKYDNLYSKLQENAFMSEELNKNNKDKQYGRNKN